MSEDLNTGNFETNDTQNSPESSDNQIIKTPPTNAYHYISGESSNPPQTEDPLQEQDIEENSLEENSQAEKTLLSPIKEWIKNDKAKVEQKAGENFDYAVNNAKRFWVGSSHPRAMGRRAAGAVVGGLAAKEVYDVASNVIQKITPAVTEISKEIQQVATPVIEQTTSNGQQFIGEAANAIGKFSESSELAAAAGIAATITVVNEGRIIVTETIKEGIELSKRALKRTSIEGSTTIDTIKENFIPMIENSVKGKFLTRPGVQNFTEQAVRMANKFVTFGLNQAAEIDEAVVEIAKPTSDRLGDLNDILSPAKSKLQNVQEQLEGKDFGIIAKALEKTQGLINRSEKIYENASKIVESSTKRAAQARDTANSVDAALQAIADEVGGNIQMKGEELLAQSVTHREKIINSLSTQFSKERFSRGKQKAFDTLLSSAKGILGRYHAQSPVCKVAGAGGKIVRGIGAYAKRTATQAAQVINSVPNLRL